MKFFREDKKITEESKLKSNLEIDKIVKSIRKEKKSIALCHGVFDLLHPGHYEHLRQAASLADILILSVTADEYVNKGPGRPLYDQFTRARVLASLEIVDFVIISNSMTAEQNLNIVKPDFYVKGPDYLISQNDLTGRINKEKKIVEKLGGTIYFTTGFTASSSNLINKFFSPNSTQLKQWIDSFKSEFSFEHIKNLLNAISNLKVLILGELIIDQYTFCRPLSKSSKDPILAFHQQETKLYKGGVLAIAESCGNWVAKTKLISFAGAGDSSVNFFIDSLKSKIQCEIIQANDRPTILKHRYVDTGSTIRVFEYYDFSDEDLPPQVQNQVLDSISKNVSDFDLVIAADYGHGYFSAPVIRLIESTSSFLAVNTQANAGNRGYNTISKYSRVDFISINGSELQLELRNKRPEYTSIVPQIMKQKKASYAIVTLGADGLIAFDRFGNYEKVPAFGSKVVDKVGAGDAVFIMGSVLAKTGTPLKVMGFLASLAAAHEVSQLGHQSSISFSDLLKQTQSILK